MKQGEAAYGGALQPLFKKYIELCNKPEDGLWANLDKIKVGIDEKVVQMWSEVHEDVPRGGLGSFTWAKEYWRLQKEALQKRIFNTQAGGAR